MTKQEILKKLFDDGKIDEARYTAGLTKINIKETAKEKYKKDKAKLTKTELQDILDTIIP